MIKDTEINWHSSKEEIDTMTINQAIEILENHIAMGYSHSKIKPRKHMTKALEIAVECMKNKYNYEGENKMFDMTCKEIEKDFELKIAKATQKTTEEQPTLMQIYSRLNKLELENEMLKANNYELQKQNLQLRSDNMILHNKLNGNCEGNNDIGMLNEYEEEYLCGCESEEELRNYEKALNNMSVKK